MAGAGSLVTQAGPGREGRERMAGCQRQDLAGDPGAVAQALSGAGVAAQSFRQPGTGRDSSQPVALAVAATPGGIGAASSERAFGFVYPFGLQRAATDSGGAPAGVVRPGRDTANCRRSPGGETAPAVAGPAPGAGDPGPGELLAQHLRRSEEGPQRTLSEALLAG